MDAASIPGATVAVSYDDQIVWSEGFGLANVELNVPATPESKFRIASISKNLTGTAVGRLVEERRLELDAPIGNYVPNLPAIWDGITARQLATHTSGIAHYTDEADALETRHFNTTAQALEKIAARPMAEAPGTAEQYSSYAYTVLAAVIEGASGKDFLTYMREEIFAPLGMSDTLPDQVLEVIPGRTGFYGYGPERQLQNAPYVDLSDRWAGSGFLSTAEDLARFGAAHCGPGFLQQPTLELLVTRTVLPDSSITRDGLGWGPRKDWDGRRMIFGNGITPGATGVLVVWPEARLSMAVLTNIRRAPLDRPELQILALRFLDAIEGNATLAADPALSGDWDLAARQDDKRFEATMRLSITGGACGGTIMLPGGEQLDIIDGMQRGSQQWLIALHPGAGLLPVRLGPAGAAGSAGVAWEGEVLRLGIALEATRHEAPPDSAAPPDDSGY
jgi:CubicO group peptidase (beta-lactamase class C family)